MGNFWILAQTDGGAPSGISSEPVTSEGQTTTTEPAGTDGTTTAPRSTGFGGAQQFIFLGLMFVLMYVILFRGPRKKQQQHKQMMAALGKNDKVQTIGGIVGTVVDVKDDEVTLKIDESNNTKMKVLRSAISRNLSKDKP